MKKNKIKKFKLFKLIYFIALGATIPVISTSCAFPVKDNSSTSVTVNSPFNNINVGDAVTLAYFYSANLISYTTGKITTINLVGVEIEKYYKDPITNQETYSYWFYPFTYVLHIEKINDDSTT